MDPHADFQDRLYERLLEKRIVMATGLLDDAAATRLSAQLVALDAEGDGAIRLELQNLRADLPAALAVMGVLDVVRAPVHAHASGEIRGAALGVLAACQRRLAYPNASFALSEPRLEFGGTVTAVTERQRQTERMVDSLYYRIAEADRPRGRRGPRGLQARPDAHHRRGHRLRPDPLPRSFTRRILGDREVLADAGVGGQGYGAGLGGLGLGARPDDCVVRAAWVAAGMVTVTVAV